MTRADDRRASMRSDARPEGMRAEAEMHRLIFELLAHADTPLSTEQIVAKLELREIGTEIYSVLFAMQCQGLISRLGACPFTWAAATSRAGPHHSPANGRPGSVEATTTGTVASGTEPRRLFSTLRGYSFSA
ncbi:MAG: hypothetical protein R3245_00555 [Kiloniellales bacterium]|nr:hypothetical protein [Kiloniellales bacterium]